jgi:hypothetical protein
MRTFPVSVTGDASLIRPTFSPGLLLEDDDLTRAVDFTRALNNVLLRAMLGAGVLCGFKVHAVLTGCCVRITIRRGVAIDCSGALIELKGDEKAAVEIACERLNEPATFWVVISRTERSCAQRDLSCCEDDNAGATVATRLLDGYKIEVFDRDLGAAWTRKAADPADGDCTECCGDKPKPVLLARIDYAQNNVRVTHGERSYVRPARAPDPIHDPVAQTVVHQEADQAEQAIAAQGDVLAANGAGEPEAFDAINPGAVA